MSATPSINHTNVLAFNLLSNLINGEKTPNVFISPFSIFAATGMLARGSSPNTLKTIQEVLQSTSIGENGSTMVKDMKKSILSDSDDKTEIKIANSIWVKKSDIKQDFVDDLASNFDAEVQPLTTPEPINSWCNKNTNGKISHVVDAVDPLDIAILVNAIYFKGAWKNPFNANETRDGIFQNYQFSQEKVKLMKLKKKLPYKKTKTHHVLALPYGKGNVEALIILPIEKPQKAQNKLSMTKEEFEVATSNLKVTDGILMLPKFKLDYSAELIPVMKGMGIEFPEGSMARMSDDNSAYVSRILHKSILEVDEEGTVAAAVTAVKAKKRSRVAKATFDMTCDHPFIFAIRHKKTNTILFIGSINSIAQTKN